MKNLFMRKSPARYAARHGEGKGGAGDVKGRGEKEGKERTEFGDDNQLIDILFSQLALLR